MAVSPRPRVVLLTCEHGGNDVPGDYERLFSGRRRLLKSHRGLDIGARDAARYLQRRLDAPLICARVTRLLVDLNRSAAHPALFSDLTRRLAAADRLDILARYYHPYRQLVAEWIASSIRRGQRVLHISVHSFTPVLDGATRRADVGLLYDPERAGEARFCRDWQRQLAGRDGPWVVRRNYPYRGTADGQVLELRRRFSGRDYLGIELELNQATLANARSRVALLHDLGSSLPLDR
jgi:predicted N-formylglutamate amidohydrolase